MSRKFPSPNARYTIKDGVTQTLLNTFCTCRQKCRLMLDGWEKPLPSYFDFGEFVHLCLERWYGKRLNVKVPEVFFRNLGKRFVAYKAKQRVPDIATVEETIKIAVVVVTAYVEYWKKSDAKIRYIALEKVFDIKFNGFRLRGKIDGIFMRGKEVWIRETKTKSQVNETNLVELLSFDSQSLFYLTSEMNLPTGVLYDVIRNPNLYQRKEESQENYLGRLREDIRKKPEHYFKRYETPYSPRQREQFRVELQAKLIEFNQWLDGNLSTYKNESSCMARGRCTYIEACSTGKLYGYKQTKKLFSELEDSPCPLNA